MDAVKVNAISEELLSTLVRNIEQSGLGLSEFVNQSDGHIEFVKDKGGYGWFVIRGTIEITPRGAIDFARTDDLLMVMSSDTLKKSTLSRDYIVSLDYATVDAFKSALEEMDGVVEESNERLNDGETEGLSDLARFELHLGIRDEFRSDVRRKDGESTIDYARRVSRDSAILRFNYCCNVDKFEEVLKDLVLNSVTMPKDDLNQLFYFRDRIVSIANKHLDDILFSALE